MFATDSLTGFAARVLIGVSAGASLNKLGFSTGILFLFGLC